MRRFIATVLAALSVSCSTGDESGRAGDDAGPGTEDAANTGTGGRADGAGGRSASGGASSDPGGSLSAGGAASDGGSSTSGGTSSGGAATGDAGPDGTTCDPRQIMCRRAPPVCVEGEVPSVVGTCYGDCVPIDACICSEPEACPDSNQYTCHNFRQRCGPYLR